MGRFGWWLIAGLVPLGMIAPEVAWAAERTVGDLSDSNPFIRGPGFYISIVKLVLFVPVFWAWAFTTTWVSVDTQTINWPSDKWNALMLGTGLGGILLFFLIPWFWLGYPLLLAAYIAPLSVYITKRNAAVSDSERVLTPQHIQNVLKNLGLKSKKKPKVTTVNMVATAGKDQQENQVLLLSAKRLEGLNNAEEIYTKLEEFLSLPILSQGTRIQVQRMLMEISPQGTGVRYQVNGMWEVAPGTDFESAKGFVAICLRLCGLNHQDLRNAQVGKFLIKAGNRKIKTTFRFQPMKGGARTIWEFDHGEKKLEGLDQHGMGEKLFEHVKATVRVKQGIVIGSAPAGGGFTSAFNATGHALDRYNRAYAELGDAARPEEPVDNAEVFTYDSSAGETPSTILPKVLRQYPEGYICRNVTEAETLRNLLELANDDKIVLLGTPAKEACEAPYRFLILKDSAGNRIPPQEFAASLVAVVNMRLARKLCPDCRVEFEPDAALLQRLGIKPDPNRKYYKQFQPNPEKKEAPCTACNGRGFVGRTGMFEFLAMNDHLRQVLAQGVNLDTFRNEAVKSGALYRFQQDGVRLFAEGLTSLEEVQRALKEG